MEVQRYQKHDLQSAMKLINIHMTKLNSAIESNNYPEACSALRAMQDECSNANKMAATLSLSSHLNSLRR